MKRLVLVGGGHAHLEVLRQLARRRLADTEVLLVSPFVQHHYSGMVPGYLQGTYAERALAFDLPALCAAAGARFREGYVGRVDAGGRWVELGDERLECDLVSADVGSAPLGLDDVPGVRAHAYTVRPMSRVVALRARLDATMAGVDAGPDGHGTPAVCVVGGGAGGVEVALAVRRLAEDSARAGATPITVTIVDRSPTLLADYAPPARGLVERILAARGIRVVTGTEVARVTADAVVLASGESVRSTTTVWLTGAAPTALTRASALPADARGFWLVDDTLRSAGGGAVWGAGDCVTLASHPGTSKAGVYAVRQGPVLAHNIRASIEGGPMRTYTPQRQFLALLNTADGRAVLRWHGLTTHARWAWWLKDTIDRRFMRRYAI